MQKNSYQRSKPAPPEMLRVELLREIEEAERDLKKAKAIETKCHDLIYIKGSRESDWFWKGVVDEMFVKPLREGRERLIKRNKMYLDTLDGKPKQKGGVSDNEIARAKEYPIEDLLDFRRNITTCLWHNEKTGSLHYYAFDNHVHCFGCGKSADAIDVYRQLNSVDFISAVKALQ